MELKNLMQNAGMVGAGGAGFPSYAKISGGLKTLLINGAECEPLLYTDYILLKNEMTYILTGIEAVADACGINECLLCIKLHTAKRLSLAEGEALSDKVKIKVLPDVYPIGDEVSLTYQATGRLIQPGTLPSTVGVIVYNVETMYNLGIALRLGKPVTHKWLTVGGETPHTYVVRVPIGVRVCDLFDRLGIKVPEGYSVIDGGPSMGKLIRYETAAVTKTTKGLLLLPDSCRAVESKRINERAAVARAETACCQCTRCTDMCPRHLLGFPLEPHKMVRTAMGAVEVMPVLITSATLCCGCGICENLACSQGISPKAVINNFKAILAKNKMRYTSTDTVSPAPEREYRMIPSVKWASDLGVAKYDTVPDIITEISDFKRLDVPLGKHIGAPSQPTVSDGDYVCEGDVIAAAAVGLSVPQHAPMAGRVTVLSDKIIIDRVEE